MSGRRERIAPCDVCLITSPSISPRIFANAEFSFNFAMGGVVSLHTINAFVVGLPSWIVRGSWDHPGTILAPSWDLGCCAPARCIRISHHSVSRTAVRFSAPEEGTSSSCRCFTREENLRRRGGGDTFARCIRFQRTGFKFGTPAAKKARLPCLARKTPFFPRPSASENAPHSAAGEQNSLAADFALTRSPRAIALRLLTHCPVRFSSARLILMARRRPSRVST